MLRLERIFENLFNDAKIAASTLYNFAADSIERLRANNSDGTFNQILEETENKYRALGESLGLLSSDESQREGRTKDMNKTFDTFQKEVSHTEGLISYTYGKDSGTYQEFYPHGVTEYYQMTLDNAEIIMDRYVTAVNAHAADLPAAVPIKFQQILTDFKDSRKKQLSEKGEVAGSRNARDNAARELQIQLTKNVLFIAYHFAAQPEKASVYFDQSILTKYTGRTVVKIIGSVEGNELQQVRYDAELITNNTPLTFSNTSPITTLEFGFVEVEGNSLSELKVAVPPNESRTITAAEVGFSETNRILQVNNLSSIAAEYVVEMPD